MTQLSQYSALIDRYHPDALTRYQPRTAITGYINKCIENINKCSENINKCSENINKMQ